jgi:hypothetical protein
VKLNTHGYSNKSLAIPKDAQIKLSQLLIFLMKETIRIPNMYGLMVPLLV